MDPSGIRAPGGDRWLKRAEQFTDAFGLVLGLVLVTYVLTSLLSNDGWAAVLVMLSVSATSIVALTSSYAPPHYVHIAFYLSALGLVLAVIAAISGDSVWLSLGAVVQVALLAAAMAAVLMRVVGTAEVGARTILGAISVYTVLGLLFAFVYEAVGRIQGNPFFEGHPQVQHGDYLFFSYTTLTTTGYGNLVPGGQPGRMIAGLEMLIGQIFLVTLVAGLVSLWRPGERLKARRERREKASAPDQPEPLSD
ncbi:MAG TPA: ion channel [Solirubrobacterales bacterium]|nr:ion channel [Solirubrobacterales bacterium]